MLGKFNPAIFSPAWLAKSQFISDDEMETARVNVIHQEVTQSIAGSFKFDINQQRFLVSSSDEPFVRLLGLTSGIFGANLIHTPLEKLGINFEVVYSCRSARQRMNFGRALAPLGPWGDFGARVSAPPLERAGGITSITMQENPEDRIGAGYRRVEVEPVLDRLRVKISVNDHFEVADLERVDGASEIVEILEAEFDASLVESKKIVGDLIDVSTGLPE